jgi:Regulator of chromosome condensation (RCC1) repeat
MRSCWGLVLLIFAGCDGFHSATPVGAHAASLSLAYGKSCARMSNGSVRCWGNRASMRLQYVREGDSAPFDVRPRLVPDVGGVVALATNLTHDCALAGDRTVTCWSDEEAPAMWTAATGSAGIANGGFSFSFIDSDRVLRMADYLSPLQSVSGGTDVVEVANAWSGGCLRHTDGTVACGGANDSGQLGDGTKTDSATFVPVVMNERAVELAVGERFGCLLGESGFVYCWGANDRGQLGDGTTVPHPIPRMMTTLSWSNHIVVGRSHACATDINGNVRCWGANDRGQLGDGTTHDRYEPVLVPGLEVSSVAAAWFGDHNCAITREGVLVCWGANERGQLGDGTTDDRSLPTPTAL